MIQRRAMLAAPFILPGLAAAQGTWPQRPVRVRFQTRRAGFDKARGAMRDFTLLLALAWGAAEVALWLSGG